MVNDGKEPMGKLLRLRTRVLHRLTAEHLVGRKADCALVLDTHATSTLHALLRWDGQGWSVRDLSSRNGTYVNHLRVTAPTRLREKDMLCFGDLGDVWSMVSTAGPGRPRSCRAPVPTAPVTRATLRRATATFRVSRDQETVSLIVRHDGVIHRLASFAANEVLLVLARARIDDRAADRATPADVAEHGWVEFDTLLSRCGLDPRNERHRSRLRNWIRECRRRFRGLGFVDAQNIVERRAPRGPVRLGVGELVIES